jgi:hypothetical protein
MAMKLGLLYTSLVRRALRYNIYLQLYATLNHGR